MSAAATAAGYLYASGRLGKRRRHRRELVERLVKRFNVSPARARELASEACAMAARRASIPVVYRRRKALELEPA